MNLQPLRGLELAGTLTFMSSVNDRVGKSEPCAQGKRLHYWHCERDLFQVGESTEVAVFPVSVAAMLCQGLRC